LRFSRQKIQNSILSILNSIFLSNTNMQQPEFASTHFDKERSVLNEDFRPQYHHLFKSKRSWNGILYIYTSQILTNKGWNSFGTQRIWIKDIRRSCIVQKPLTEK
jgi:hypothetical protein